MGGRVLATLGCVIALAVMAGIVGAVTLIGGFGWVTQQAQAVRPTPTVGYVESMKPIPGRLNAEYTMAADQEGAARISRDQGAAQAMIATNDAFFLANGTRVQILQVVSPMARVQVMDGQHQNRVGWLPINVVGT